MKVLSCLSAAIALLGVGSLAFGEVAARAVATAAQSSLPAGAGLAAKYPGGVGIEKKQTVLFAEDFEAGRLDAVAKRWDDVSNKIVRT
jgi:hypothetical protein